MTKKYRIESDTTPDTRRVHKDAFLDTYSKWNEALCMAVEGCKKGAFFKIVDTKTNEVVYDSKNPPPLPKTTNKNGYKIESDFKLRSDFIPQSEYTRVYKDWTDATSTAIEGVEDPTDQEVRIVDLDNGNVVWRSTDEEFENKEDY